MAESMQAIDPILLAFQMGSADRHQCRSRLQRGIVQSGVVALDSAAPDTVAVASLVVATDS